MTLQIAWSGVAPSHDKPELVPRFPTLQAERFMAYQASSRVRAGSSSSAAT